MNNFILEINLAQIVFQFHDHTIIIIYNLFLRIYVFIESSKKISLNVIFFKRSFDTLVSIDITGTNNHWSKTLF